jgi:thiol-disulfide isomerase/thioredoxin
MLYYATRSFVGLAFVAFAATAIAQQPAAGVDAAAMLKFKPARLKVDYETPAAADAAKCRVETEQRGNAKGFALYGPQGQILRRWLTYPEGRGTVNEIRYYNSGMEVYREADTNGDAKVDSFRWAGSGGTRWAIDSNADGKIDRWQQITAEETTLEAINAMASGDATTLQSLMLTADDVRGLGIAPKVAERLLAGTKDVAGSMRQAMAGSKTLTAATEWERFDCSMRVASCLCAVPGKWEKDQLVYENVMALVRNGTETGFVQIGELVKVGDVWKLTRVPKPIEGENPQVEGGVLLQESLDGGGGPTEGLSPEAQQLVEDLRKLDESRPVANAPKAEVEKYNVARADLIVKLARASTSDTERILWWKQAVEGIAANIQMGVFPNGLARLLAIEKEIETTGLVELNAFTKFRVLLLTFADKMNKAVGAVQKREVQDAHLQDLRAFVGAYPASEEAPEAIWQIATTIEFNGDTKEATVWYQLGADRFGSKPGGRRSKGALNRLNLNGKPFALSGPALDGKSVVDVASLRGRVVAVVFWATWFRPSVDETPQLVELYEQHHPKGFEIVGLNLDSEGVPIANFLKEHRVTWPQISDPGGMEDGKAAREFGITAPGTIFLIGKDGKVISNSASVEDLKKLLPGLL